MYYLYNTISVETRTNKNVQGLKNGIRVGIFSGRRDYKLFFAVAIM